MLDKLQEIEKRYVDLSRSLGDPERINDPARYQKIAKEHSELGEVVSLYREYKATLERLKEAKEILKESEDTELLELAESEKEESERKKEDIELRLQSLLIPKDPQDGRNTIVEIRAGTGGEEAALFAGDLLRMYSKYAEKQRWTIEPLSSHPTEIGGFKEVIFLVSGKDAYGKLKYESGVHRVQRIPVTEASGRIHTSAASVVVLSEAEEVDVHIAPEDLRIEVFRSSGPGGQSVNTTDSAVRITHIPTGLVVTCQDEKSQHKNKTKALKVLRARLLDMAQKEQQQKVTENRRMQVGTGDRSEKIRTYNFPQGRVTDHRIKLTLHKLDNILEGDIDDLIKALKLADHQARMSLS